jgi:hypothetical protein
MSLKLVRGEHLSVHLLAELLLELGYSLLFEHVLLL